MAVKTCVPEKGRERILNPYTGKCVFKDGKVGMWLLGAGTGNGTKTAKPKTPAAPRKSAKPKSAAPKNSKTCKKSIFHYPWKVLKHSSWFLGWVFTMSLAVYLFTKQAREAAAALANATETLTTATANATKRLGNAATNIFESGAKTVAEVFTNQVSSGINKGAGHAKKLTELATGRKTPEILYEKLINQQTVAWANTYAESCLKTAEKHKIASNIYETAREIELACSFTTIETMERQQALVDKVLDKEISPNILFLLRDTVMSSRDFSLGNGVTMQDAILPYIKKAMRKTSLIA